VIMTLSVNNLIGAVMTFSAAQPFKSISNVLLSSKCHGHFPLTFSSALQQRMLRRNLSNRLVTFC
jgi:hypothetical protein